MKVAIAATHPIQYHAPWFRGLAESGTHDFKVCYGILPDATDQGIGFGTDFHWDIPLLEGYQWELLENRSKKPGLGSFGGCSTPGIGDFLYREKVDVLIVTGWHSKMLLQAVWAARKLKIPVIVRGESNALKSRTFHVRQLHRLLIHRFDRVLSIGTLNREFYLGYGYPARHIFDAPYFVDNQRFVISSETAYASRVSTRNNLGIPENSFCFVYSGKLIDKKCVAHLLEAFAKLYERNPNIHLLIVGDGGLKPRLQERVKAGGLPVTFAGFINQSEIPTMYAVSDCLVLCSDYDETWGLVVNEAMACGLPAIVSDRVGCGPDLVLEGETGPIYPFGNIEALTMALGRLAGDRENSRKMGEKAQQHVMKNNTPARTVQATLDALDSL